ncbi:DUF2614 family zinc ribbon-containing protein [Brevibacillus sp. H7]|uniref:DUF2614 family zinc ribbon-containing protein n=1 Tax=Brevibacillus sp. H7 TaxID=3349138 RepID=UPI0037F481C0
MKNIERLNKIKRIRTWANWNMGLSILFMFVGMGFFLYFRGTGLQSSFQMLFLILLMISFFMMMIGTVLYMISGMVSTSAPVVECPSCHKATKMLGKEDACMFCGQPLRLDEERAQEKKA